MRTFLDIIYAPVAQLDRVLVSEAKGHRFDSCRAHHIQKGLISLGKSAFLHFNSRR
jgi:hypothetical protein